MRDFLRARLGHLKRLGVLVLWGLSACALAEIDRGLLQDDRIVCESLDMTDIESRMSRSFERACAGKTLEKCDDISVNVFADQLQRCQEVGFRNRYYFSLDISALPRYPALKHPMEKARDSKLIKWRSMACYDSSAVEDLPSHEIYSSAFARREGGKLVVNEPPRSSDSIGNETPGRFEIDLQNQTALYRTIDKTVERLHCKIQLYKSGLL